MVSSVEMLTNPNSRASEENTFCFMMNAMSIACNSFDSPPISDVWEDTFNNHDWFHLPESFSPSVWSGSHHQHTATLPNSILSQDAIAAGEEIDSIVNELWRTADTGDRSETNFSPTHSPLNDLAVVPSVMQLQGVQNEGDVAVVPCVRSVQQFPNSCNLEQNVSNYDSHPAIKAVEETGKRNQCDACGKCYAWSSDLLKHKRIHTDKRYPCTNCDKSYFLESDLLKHLRIHAKDKEIVCKFCGKLFTTSGDLHKHVRIHTGERPFSCKLCRKSFSASDNFRKHMRIHSGEKPLSCSECGQKFLRKSNLLQHNRIHSGEKPFNCDLCGLNFTQKTHLKNHIKTHSGQKPFQCLKCELRFTRNADLQRHYKRAHEERKDCRSI